MSRQPAYTCEQAIADYQAAKPVRDISERLGFQYDHPLYALLLYHGIPYRRPRRWQRPEDEPKFRCLGIRRHALHFHGGRIPEARS